MKKKMKPKQNRTRGKKETELKGPENVFHNIIEVYFPSLKKKNCKGTRDIENIK